MVHRKDLQIRDPYIYPMGKENRYYLFGTTDRNPWNSPGCGFEAYYSEDLEYFTGPFSVFSPGKDFWGTHDFWAPEVHYFNEMYYLFASFTSRDKRRGTQILSSPQILGPYVPLSNRAVTPAEWDCLDGTLFIDESSTPWIVFCHEWVQSNDGEIQAMPLLPDLKKPAGEPVLLFRASSALWPTPIERRDGSGRRDAFVTDGPFLFRQKDGKLTMLWSSLGEQGYAMGCAVSKSGNIKGSWQQIADPIVSHDGGHGMVFRDFSGQLNIAYHSPNKTPFERFVYTQVIETETGLIIKESGAAR